MSTLSFDCGGGHVCCRGCGLEMDFIGSDGAVTVLQKHGHTVTVKTGTFEQRCRKCGEVTPVHVTSGTVARGLDRDTV